MNSTTEVPKEVKAQDDARANLAAVRMPWHKWQTSSLQLAAAILLMCSFAVPGSVVPEKWSRATLLVVALVLWILNDYYRERAWRRFIEREAPELYRKINRHSA
jgi:uncharacterized membrane protein YoaK (UPF0700 family)